MPIDAPQPNGKPTSRPYGQCSQRHGNVLQRTIVKTRRVELRKLQRRLPPMTATPQRPPAYNASASPN